MRPSFSRSLRALDAERGLRPLVLMGVVAALLGAWAAWSFTATITIYEISEHARVEARYPALPVDPPVAGEVVDNRLVLGRLVHRGEVLVRLDSTEQELELAELELRAASLRRQLAAVDEQIDAEQTSYVAAGVVARRAAAAATARRGFADTMSRISDEQEERTRTLSAADVVSRMDFLALQAQTQRRRQEARSGTLDAKTEAAARRLEELGHNARLKELERERAVLRGTLESTRIQVSRLEHEIEARTVRAASSGRVVQVVEAPAGTFVEAGRELGPIVSGDGVRVVADFAPAAVVGRIHPGQRADLRLDNYPWTQYGTVTLEVTRVASEPIDGVVRVEMQAEPAPGMSLEHGLTGVVEVEVERASPAVLVLRAAGQLLMSRSAGEPDSPSLARR